MWLRRIICSVFRAVFTPPPPEPIWQWAEKNVWLARQDAAQGGFYRSAKTPWTRRVQEIARDPRMFVPDFTDPQNPRWVVVKVREGNIKKSSQSGVSEALLNCIRWFLKYARRNFIYNIDKKEEAQNIIRRLKPFLKKIDPDLAEMEDKKDGALVLKVAGVLGWFFGSFSTGSWANKQAPFIVNDELEEHKRHKTDTTTDRALASRRKTADDGLQFNLGKPKRSGGPVVKCFERGNKEEFHIRCPHCGSMQWLTFHPEERKVPFSDELEWVESEGLRQLLPKILPKGQTRIVTTGRIAFDQCKTMDGEWDLLRVMREAAHECGHCKQIIPPEQKKALVAEAVWLPTSIGTPGIVSQHINDLYSEDEGSSPGQLAIEYLDAVKEGSQALQGFWNHRCGNEAKDEASESDEDDILENIAGLPGNESFSAFRKGTLPPETGALLLGSDVGGNYAKWALIAVTEEALAKDHIMELDVAVVDWGEELDPSEVADIFQRETWAMEGGKRLRIAYGFQDAKFRRRDVYTACLSVRGQKLIPVAGLGAGAARGRSLWNYSHVPTYPENFHQLTFNDREAKNDLYIEGIKKKRFRVLFPADVAKYPDFIAELTAEKMVRDSDGRFEWDDHPKANHYGDCVKVALLGLRFVTRKKRKSSPPPVEEPAAAA